MPTDDDSLPFSPAEVCELFGISKSTLLRWERDGLMSSVRRNPNNDQRIYTQEDIRRIVQQLTRQLHMQFVRTVQTDNDEQIERAYETLYFWKFLQGEPHSLEALDNFPRLSADVIRKLCRIGLERNEPSSPTFQKVAAVIANQSKKLNPTFE
jgi:DNA-binding transcriptional MerR regulator